MCLMRFICLMIGWKTGNCALTLLFLLNKEQSVSSDANIAYLSAYLFSVLYVDLESKGMWRPSIVLAGLSLKGDKTHKFITDFLKIDNISQTTKSLADCHPLGNQPYPREVT